MTSRIRYRSANWSSAIDRIARQYVRYGADSGQPGHRWLDRAGDAAPNVERIRHVAAEHEMRGARAGNMCRAPCYRFDRLRQHSDLRHQIIQRPAKSVLQELGRDVECSSTQEFLQGNNPPPGGVIGGLDACIHLPRLVRRLYLRCDQYHVQRPEWQPRQYLAAART